MEGRYHNAQILFQNATLDSDEHFPFKVRDMQMKATFFFHTFNHFSTPLITFPHLLLNSY